ncbi:Hypothetical protein LUCI_3088 [Lucifera butyrica]|uniref:Uncharacterized protein n=1 Tax=Lucifera butyrica TaxID=1351585 RepID=A0A498RCL3_9FIRM|nr:Hypothetical protein LUCI_3088 [Lucifera butyrica]
MEDNSLEESPYLFPITNFQLLKDRLKRFFLLGNSNLVWKIFT